MEFHSLRVKKITTETADTKTFDFEVPAELSDIFQYKQGQHITLRTEADGREVRRAYSMSSAPHESRLAITVKKVGGGKISTWLNDHVKEGDSLEIAAPDGRFFNQLGPEKRRTYFLFAAGSGITPIVSIAKTVLEEEPMSTIYLLYGSRNEESIIFREELDLLSSRYSGQMNVEHLLSQPKKESSGGGLFGLFKKATTHWQGKKGRIDVRVVGDFLDENLVQGPEDEVQYFICGPGNMADIVKAALLGRGIASKQIHTEHFVNSTHAPGEVAANLSGTPGGGATLIAHLKGQRIELPMTPGATILDTLLSAKYDPPYSCTAGACATCMAKVVQGKVTMDACYALEDDEVKAGYCLTCQAKPDTDLVEVNYDM